MKRFSNRASLLLIVSWLLSPLLAAEEDGKWYFGGQLQVGVFADSIYADPFLTADRTPVFGEDGSTNPDADNSCVPTGLDPDTGSVTECRDFRSDTPVFGGTFSGSRVLVGHRGNAHNVLLEGVLEGDRDDPFTPSLYRLWADYKSVSFGYGWSTFGDFQRNFYPHFIEYNGPVGFPYKRQFALRLKLGRDYYLGFEEPDNPVYRGFGLTDGVLNNVRNSDRVIDSPKEYVVTLNSGEIRRYEIGRLLRGRGVLPDFVFSFYRKREESDWLISLILRYVRLDNNAPLFFETDTGLLQLTADAPDSPQVVDTLDKELALNQALAGGENVLSPGLHLGGRWSVGAASAIQLAYIYNGGTYLRDNPNPSYLVVPTSTVNGEATSYDLQEIDTHSYVFGVDFGKRYNLVLSGIITDRKHEIPLGGGSTKELHSLHFNYLQEVRDDLHFTYELAYLHHETFNGRDNSKYPRLRMQYGVSYDF